MEKETNEAAMPNSPKTGINKPIIIIILSACILVAVSIVFFYGGRRPASVNKLAIEPSVTDGLQNDNAPYWMAADIDTVNDHKLKAQLQYGKELIAHTSKYLGPRGSVLQISNGLNCQNCHLQAGTAVYGNNYGSVASLYPKFRARSGTVENIFRRINDCIERSLNGKPIDTSGKEMAAIVAYITFIGSNVEKGTAAKGSGFKELAFLERAADPQKGKLIYISKCQSCHQADGVGKLNPEGDEYVFPALWGKHSFNDGAGLFRISSVARYVKYNMPQGATFKNPVLTDEAAWDVAAFISSQKRPHINKPNDWPDISKKPIDHPFGPYADKLSERQHKYGPFYQPKIIINK